MKQFLKDLKDTLAQLIQIPIGIGIMVGLVYLAVALVEELGIKKVYGPYFLVVQAFFIGVTLKHFFGVKEE